MLQLLPIDVQSGVDFINVKRTNFLYERHFGSFYYVHVTRKKADKTTSVQKIHVFNIDEIDYRGKKVRRTQQRKNRGQGTKGPEQFFEGRTIFFYEKGLK